MNKYFILFMYFVFAIYFVLRFYCFWYGDLVKPQKKYN